MESARVDGKPRTVSQTYLGFSEEVLAKLTSAEASATTLRSAHTHSVTSPPSGACSDPWTSHSSSTTSSAVPTRSRALAWPVPGHRCFWDAMNQLTPTHLEDVSARITARIVKDHDLDTSTLALDMTNFAKWAYTNNGAASLPSQEPRNQPETARWRPATGA